MEKITLVGKETGVPVAEVPKLAVDLYKKYALEANGLIRWDPIDALLTSIEMTTHHPLRSEEDEDVVDQILYDLGFFGIEGFILYKGLSCIQNFEHVCKNCSHCDESENCDVKKTKVDCSFASETHECYEPKDRWAAAFPGLKA